MLSGKHIVLGVTGSIAAYKACQLVRLLLKAGAEVQAVLTPSAKEFITPLTLATLTRRPVVSEFFDRRDGSWHSHVDLGLWADAFVVAPASASTLAKMACGIADNMLLTTYLSMRAPAFVAPAMDMDMWAHPATQHNLSILRQRGVQVIEPGSGFLASTLEGKGRMEEPERIASALDRFFSQQDAPQPLSGQTLLVTVGPTYEKIDPVRFIGNYSSGKMGLALVGEALRRGARVELVLGPVSASLADLQPASRLHVTRVESAAEMHAAATALFPGCQAALLCAAVADFTPAAPAAQKIKREATGELTLRLTATHDIAACLGQMKRPEQRIAGFALETDSGETHAADKLRRKRLDFIVLNSLKDSGAGFAVDTNKVTILRADGSATPFPLKPKSEVAADVIDELQRILPAPSSSSSDSSSDSSSSSSSSPSC